MMSTYPLNGADGNLSSQTDARYYFLVDTPRTEASLWQWLGGELVVADPVPKGWRALAEAALESPQWTETPVGSGWLARVGDGQGSQVTCLLTWPGGVEPDVAPPDLADRFALLSRLVLAGVSHRQRLQGEEWLRRLRAERLRAMADFAAGFGHDFNNLLASICLRGEIGAKRTTDQTSQQCFRAICGSAMEAAEIVWRLQQFAGTHSRQDAELLDLGQLMREILAHNCPLDGSPGRTGQPSILVHASLDDDLHVLLNVEDLREILTQLVENALEAMPGGGELWVEAGASDDHVTLRVRDNGEGMTPEVLSRAYEPFFTTRDRDHAGLGLSVSLGLATRWDGNISLESRPGEGATAELRLPLADLSTSPARRTRRAEAAVPPSTDLSILVVDDQEEVRETLALSLEAMRHRVVQAGDGHEAMQLIRRHGFFDAIVLDLDMPEVSGWQVAEFAHKLEPSSAVLLLTGWGDRIADRNDGRVDMVLTKPITGQELDRAISRAVAQKRPPATNSRSEGVFLTP